MTDGVSTTKFISRWQAASGSENANYQLFITELCELLELPKPDPAREDTRDNAVLSNYSADSCGRLAAWVPCRRSFRSC